MSLHSHVGTSLDLLTSRSQLLLSTTVYVGFNACFDLATGGELMFVSYPGIQMGFFTEGVGTGVIATIVQLYSILQSDLGIWKQRNRETR